MTFDYQLVKLMNLLDDGKYHTLNQLAGEMRISEKTLRKLTKELEQQPIAVDDRAVALLDPQRADA